MKMKERLEAIETLQNYLMRDLTSGEVKHIMSTSAEDLTSEILESLSLTSENKAIFEKTKELISSYFTQSCDDWSKCVESIVSENRASKVIDNLKSMIDQLEVAEENRLHKNDGYTDETDANIDKYFDSDATLTEYKNEIDKFDLYFERLLAGKELEMSEEDFEKVADRFFSEEHEGCWNLSYKNGTVRMTCEK